VVESNKYERSETDASRVIFGPELRLQRDHGHDSSHIRQDQRLSCRRHLQRAHFIDVNLEVFRTVAFHRVLLYTRLVELAS
jgi:hypothetical protein